MERGNDIKRFEEECAGERVGVGGGEEGKGKGGVFNDFNRGKILVSN